jgi:general nucleoside transport system permease protein
MSEQALSEAIEMPHGAARRLTALWRSDAVTSVLWSLGAVVLALAVGGVLITASGADVVAAYDALVQGGLGSPAAIGATLQFATPLILVGAGTAFAFRSGAFNIGGEGQIFLGALGAAVVGLYLPIGAGPVHIALALVAGTALGAGWAFLAGAIRVFRGPHEVVVTLLMNFIAILLVQYLVQGPLDAPGSGPPESEQMLPTAILPRIWDPANLRLGIVIAIAAAALVYYLLWHTPLGFAARCLGQGAERARYAGVSVRRTFLIAMAVSGGLAGLAGSIETLGTYRRLVFQVSDGLGFEAIAVALVARLNPLAAIVAGIFFGFIRAGAVPMQLLAGVPSALVFVIQAVAILFIVAGAGLRERAQFALAVRRLRSPAGGPEQGREA